MNGMFLVVVGLAWSDLSLSNRVGQAVSWLLLVGAYANWAATTASGVLGTSKGTPIAGAGFQASPLAGCPHTDSAHRNDGGTVTRDPPFETGPGWQPVREGEPR
jgi:hypothetical protein